jgi:ABC-type branched-subunit amino acid transport system substrate-binding protein
LIGGFSDDQAEVLADVAADRDVLFANIGSSADFLRGEACAPTTFHFEASAAMYLDAIAHWFSDRPDSTWLVVHPATEKGRKLRDRAHDALSSGPAAAASVLSEPVPEIPNYGGVMRTIQDTEVDLVLLLLDWRQQLDFLGFYDALGLEPTLVALPDPVSQTRRFYDSFRDISPRHSATPRIALWDASLDTHGASELNERFFGTFGRAMDPSAWAAYEATSAFTTARTETGSSSGRALANHLRSSMADWNAHKGPSVGFRAWNHQLRQPLYAVQIDTEATRFLDLGAAVGTIPDNGGANRGFDQLGLGREESGCEMNSGG